MTPEQINIAIAEFCGLRPFLSCGSPMFCDPKNHFNLTDVPNYFGDLNACHEALVYGYKNNPSGWLARYEDTINSVCDRLQLPYWNPLCAGPDKVSEAIVRTIGKWEESK